MARLLNLPDWSAAPHLADERHFSVRSWLPAAGLVGLSVLIGLFMAKIGSFSAGLGAFGFLLIFYTGLALVPGAIYGYVRDSMRDHYVEHAHFWTHAAIGSAVSAGLWFSITVLALIFG